MSFKRITCENMNIIILLSFMVLAASVDPSPRSVNVALETSFLFEPKDVNDNISFIKNIKEFLDKLYKILEPQAKLQQQQTQFRAETELAELKPGRKFAFFEWIKNVGETFVNFTGSKIEDAVTVIQDEVNKVAEKGKQTIKEILPDTNIKAYFEESMGQIARTGGDNLKESIKSIMKEDNTALRDLAKTMNEYYTDEEVKKLHKLLRKFTRYIENKMDASKVVKEILHVAIFDKYKNLNETAKANLIKDMKLIQDFVYTNKKFKFKLQGQNQPTSIKRNDQPTAELLFGDKVESTEESTQPEKDADDDLRKYERKKTKKDDKKKGPINNEIVVDNVELIVQSLKP